MRYIFLLLLFLPSVSSAQAWKEQYDRFFAEITAADYSTAVKTGTELLEKMDKDTVYADVCFYLGNTYSALQDFPSAIKYAEMEKNIRAKKQGLHNGYYMNSIYYLANYYATIGDYDNALPLFLEVYAEQLRQFPKTHLNTIVYANYIASIYEISGATSKAQEFYENNYEVIRSAYPPTDSVYIEMMYTLTNFYTNHAIYDKAIPFYKMDCDIQEKKFGKKSDEYINSVYELGELLIYAGKYDEAEISNKEYVSLAESKYGKKHNEYATAMNNLAVTYEKQNRFKEAEDLYLKSLAIKEKNYTKKSESYALSLINLGATYDYMGKYSEAEKVLNEALEIYQELKLTETENYSTALNNIASIYTTAGKYEKAIEVLQRAMEIAKNSSGELSFSYLIALNGLASVYQSTSELDKALNYYEEAEVLYAKAMGKDHSDYGVVLFNLANVHMAKGNYEKSLEYLDKDLAIQEKSVGKVHEKFVKPLQTKAGILGLLGKTRKAEELYEEAGKLYSQLYGKMHPEYSIFLNNYGLFLFNKGDHQKAEGLMNDAWLIQVNAFGEDHPDNISLLCNIANIQVERNNFKDAEKNLLKAMEIAKTNFKPEQPDYSTTLNNLAALYYHLANYDKAEEYYKEALQLRKNFYGEKHTEYAISLNNMGTLYLGRAISATKAEDLDAHSKKAVEYFKQALAVDSLIFGSDHPELASHYNNLGEAYRLRNVSEQAEKYFIRCIEVEEKNYGNGNVRSAVTYHNLALLNAGMKNFDKAEEFAEKSISIFEKNFGKNSSSASGVTASMAFIQESKGQKGKAKEYYLASLKTQRELLERNFSFLSETEKESYTQSVTLYNDMFNSFALKAKSSDPSLVQTVYDNELYNKGLLFRSSSRVKEIVQNNGSAELMETYSAWMDARQELAVLYSTPEGERKQSVKESEGNLNVLEKQLISLSAGLKDELEMKSSDWSEVKSKLKQGQAAIEFIHFIRNDELKEDLYCALILKPNSTSPEMTELFTAAQLQNIIGKNTSTTYESVSALYGKQKNLNVELFSLVWGPLEKSLGGVNEIFYSPSGLLHKVSFSSIGDANGKYVSDKYILHQVNSTASLLDLGEMKFDPAKTTLSLIGGVNYDTKMTEQHVWSYLPGTLTEAEHIQITLEKAGVKTKVFTADAASEENLKKMDGESSPDLMHIATHGFFFGDPQEQKEKIEKKVTEVKFRGESRGIKTLVENPNPLMRSGIVLAGANDVWSETNNSIGEDGILTAYEVSLMNLQNTKLVVLSACETGLGDIKGSEGVYGLQRAFRIAGAKKMIMSLWQVPDKETDEFMTSFYDELIKTKEIRKAFTNAQKLMRAKYDPYFWGAFVLIE